MTTRQHILEILNTHGEATIEQIADALKAKTGKSVSAVTIRYHLNVLLEDGHVTQPRSVPRASRGRPQHRFSAVPAAQSRGNAAEVLTHVLGALKNQPDVVEMVLRRAAATMSGTAILPATAPLADRIAAVEGFLNERGYDASIEQVDRGFILYTRQCPYHDLPERQSVLCGLDMRLIETVLGQSVQRLMRLADGDDACAYFVTNIEENR